jgi:polar amino acid transport system permease protein
LFETIFLPKNIISGSSPHQRKSRSQSWAWNIAVLMSFISLVYLPARGTFIFKEQFDGYLELLSLRPSGKFYKLLVTLFGSACNIVGGLLVCLGKFSVNLFIRIPVSFYTEVLCNIPLVVFLYYIYYSLGGFIQMPSLIVAVA